MFVLIKNTLAITYVHFHQNYLLLHHLHYLIFSYLIFSIFSHLHELLSIYILLVASCLITFLVLKHNMPISSVNKEMITFSFYFFYYSFSYIYSKEYSYLSSLHLSFLPPFYFQIFLNLERYGVIFRYLEIQLIKGQNSKGYLLIFIRFKVIFTILFRDISLL